ncbi:6677_t:CDS:2, partial [Acaulospora colombiana]
LRENDQMGIHGLVERLGRMWRVDMFVSAEPWRRLKMATLSSLHDLCGVLKEGNMGMVDPFGVSLEEAILDPTRDQLILAANGSADVQIYPSHSQSRQGPQDGIPILRSMMKYIKDQR